MFFFFFGKLKLAGQNLSRVFNSRRMYFLYVMHVMHNKIDFNFENLAWTTFRVSRSLLSHKSSWTPRLFKSFKLIFFLPAMTLTTICFDKDPKTVSEIGSMLFRRGVSGARVVTGKEVKQIEEFTFRGEETRKWNDFFALHISCPGSIDITTMNSFM